LTEEASDLLVALGAEDFADCFCLRLHPYAVSSSRFCGANRLAPRAGTHQTRTMANPAIWEPKEVFSRTQAEHKSNLSGSLVVRGAAFQLIKTREYSPISVYKGDDMFLRLGPHDLILSEIEAHRAFANFGFPVPKIIEVAEHDGSLYCIETSLGNSHFKDLFSEANKGSIENNLFQSFLLIVQSFARHQLKTVRPASELDTSLFFSAIHIDSLISELPVLEGRLTDAFGQLLFHISEFPVVLCHGDLQPGNIFETGIIDFERSFLGPVAYDLLGNIFHPLNYPREAGYERIRKYEFTFDQISEYLQKIDDLFLSAGYSKLSDAVDDILFARTCFFVARMSREPRFQRWGYQKLDRVLAAYLGNEPLAPLCYLL
jgi:hypothetical protein